MTGTFQTSQGNHFRYGACVNLVFSHPLTSGNSTRRKSVLQPKKRGGPIRDENGHIIWLFILLRILSQWKGWMENKLLLDQKNVSLSLNPNITDKFDTRKEDRVCFIPSWKSQAYILDKFEIWSWLVCNGETTLLFTTAKPCAVPVLLVERSNWPIANLIVGQCYWFNS